MHTIFRNILVLKCSDAIMSFWVAFNHLLRFLITYLQPIVKESILVSKYTKTTASQQHQFNPQQERILKTNSRYRNKNLNLHFRAILLWKDVGPTEIKECFTLYALCYQTRYNLLCNTHVEFHNLNKYITQVIFIISLSSICRLIPSVLIAQTIVLYLNE